MVCTYALTTVAPPGVKTKFENVFQDALDRVPQDEIWLCWVTSMHM